MPNRLIYRPIIGDCSPTCGQSLFFLHPPFCGTVLSVWVLVFFSLRKIFCHSTSPLATAPARLMVRRGRKSLESPAAKGGYRPSAWLTCGQPSLGAKGTKCGGRVLDALLEYFPWCGGFWQAIVRRSDTAEKYAPSASAGNANGNKALP